MYLSHCLLSSSRESACRQQKSTQLSLHRPQCIQDIRCNQSGTVPIHGKSCEVKEEDDIERKLL